MLKVCKNQCGKCLFSKNRIVPVERKKEILQNCIENQTYFICHEHDNTVCNKFFNNMGQVSSLVRIAERIKAIEYV